jgi:S1-C subfamily serine protease
MRSGGEATVPARVPESGASRNEEKNMATGFSHQSGRPGVTVVALLLALSACTMLALLATGPPHWAWSTESGGDATRAWADGAYTAATGGAPLPADEIYRDTVAGVVKITAFDVADSEVAAAPGDSGSGFVVNADGSILTNAHVVSPGGKPVSHVDVVFKTGDSAERHVDGAVLGTDETADLAVVRVDPHAVDLTVLPLGDSAGLEVGDRVFAIGNALDYDFGMTEGIVSGLHRVLLGPDKTLIREGIQTDAAVNAGDSGGPLLDDRGAVIGVNERIATAYGAPAGNIGLAFAVPIDTAKDVLEQVRKTGTVIRPWIGIEGLSITPAAVQLLGLTCTCGVLVVALQPDGPAALAGLRGGDHVVPIPGSSGAVVAGGDIITRLGGRPVESMADVVDCVQATRPGDRLAVTYVREDAPVEAVITVGMRSADW